MRCLSRISLAFSLIAVIGCSGDAGSDDPNLGQGGKTGQGGGNSTAQGGATPGQGGATGNGGNTTTGNGGSGNGGTSNSNGGSDSAKGGSNSNTSGGSSNGGSSNGGATAKGGSANGGSNSGGSGNAKGGSSNGGSSSGGSTAKGGSGNGGAGTGGNTAKGGSGSGGAGSGGAGTGGATASGGSGTCDWSEPPANVAAWVNESWNAQLVNNIKTRKAWNLDNVMADKGQMNLCVRWGATSAVPESVKTNLSNTISRWFNDWFKGLGNYGCFPYGNGITVKVTGWAVRPGKESLLGTIDPSVPVYTEVDGEGEPKCPDACSSFVHWDHKFTGCAAGADKHSDYWLWFDDQLPGGGGAAAVGGDWGLRMPVSTFTSHFNDQSFMICEHEMGHGFGIQDYYDWTGSRPTGGSIMIVGSTGSQTPTVGDIWLLKRVWKEQKALRGW